MKIEAKSRSETETKAEKVVMQLDSELSLMRYAVPHAVT